MKNILSLQTGQSVKNPITQAKNFSKLSADTAPTLIELLTPDTRRSFDKIITDHYDVFAKPGELVQITVQELSTKRVAQFQRKHNAKKQTTNYNTNGGAKTWLQKTPLVLYVEEIGEEMIPDTMHTSAFALHVALKENPDGLIWVEKRTVQTMEQAVEIFDAWNASGIQPAGKEVSVVSSYELGLTSAIALVHVMLEVKRKFGTFQAWHSAPFAQMSTFTKAVARGKFEKSIKKDPLYKGLCEAIETQGKDSPEVAKIIKQMAIVKACAVIDNVDAWRNDTKDSVQLIEGLTDIFIELPALCEKPEPMNSFVNWLDSTVAFHISNKKKDLEFLSPVDIDLGSYRTTQEDWCFQGQRVAQKDGLSIAALIIQLFVTSPQFKDKFPSGVKGLGQTERDGLNRRVDPRGGWKPVVKR
jgi:hypothetical protein